ncbi:hypothetical protein V1506DRAFT_548304 [Lipomyces tetrasporus]
MSLIFLPKRRIAAVIMALLYLLAPVSAYVQGVLCVSAVFHSYTVEGYPDPVVEESGLVVFQDGVDLRTVMRADLLLIDDLVGSATVHTIFKVGVHDCTLYGQWNSAGDIPPFVPRVSKITCPGTDRVWTLTSSDPGYSDYFSDGSGNDYTLFGKWCGSY